VKMKTIIKKNFFNFLKRNKKEETLKNLTNFEMSLPKNRWEDQKIFVDDSLRPFDLFSFFTKKGKYIEKTFNIHKLRQNDIKLTNNEISKLNDKITVFMSFEDLLLYSYIPDENFKMYYSPQHKEADFKFSFGDKGVVYIYLQDNIQKFIDYVSSNFNLVLYHTGEEEYAHKIIETIDVNKKFYFIYGQEQCHLYFNKENEEIEYLRDINLFNDISNKRKLIISKPSYENILNADNTYLIRPFNPDDIFELILDSIINDLEMIRNYQDVREFLIPKFTIRQSLINCRMI